MLKFLSLILLTSALNCAAMAADKGQTVTRHSPPQNEFPSIVAFEELMAATPEARAIYVKRLREMMREVEDVTKQRRQLVAQRGLIDALENFANLLESTANALVRELPRLGNRCNVAVLSKEQCAASGGHGRDVCFIGGVASQFTDDGKSCRPVTRLCYDESSGQMTNELCEKSNPKTTFVCREGTTICNPELGRPEIGKRDRARTSRAFCAPVGGQGANSPASRCQVVADEARGVRLSNRDFLAIGDVSSTEKRWNANRSEFKQMCGDKSPMMNKFNCETCQFLKPRIAAIRHELTGSCSERAASAEVETNRGHQKSTR